MYPGVQLSTPGTGCTSQSFEYFRVNSFHGSISRNCENLVNASNKEPLTHPFIIVYRFIEVTVSRFVALVSREALNC